MNRLIPALGLGSAAALAAAAEMNPVTSAPSSLGAQFVFGLDTNGQPKIVEPPSKKALQGFAPQERSDAIEFDLVAGDVLKVGPVGPDREFKGKRVLFNLDALIVEEHRRNCRKVEERRPYQEPDHERGPTLHLGQQVKLLVEINYQQGSKGEVLEATFARPVTARLKDSAKVRVRMTFNPDEVVWVGRAVSAAEKQAYVDPEVARLRRERPTYRDVRATNLRVEPGDLGTLAVTVGVTRDR
jgi:hypothetical protein